MRKEQVTTEQRLHKALEKTKQPEGLPCLFPLKAWGIILEMCSAHLKNNDRSQASREYIANFAFTLRQEAFDRFGHDTPETFALAELLKALPASNGKAPQLDAMTHIARYTNKNDRLSAAQEEAAEKIKAVWYAFGKFRSSASGMNGGGGGRSQILHPMDVMDEEFLRHYRDTYVPWYTRAQMIWVIRPKVRLTGVVLKILVEDWYPERVDAAYSMNSGVALRALKNGLNGYWGGAIG